MIRADPPGLCDTAQNVPICTLASMGKARMVDAADQFTEVAILLQKNATIQSAQFGGVAIEG